MSPTWFGRDEWDEFEDRSLANRAAQALAPIMAKTQEIMQTPLPRPPQLLSLPEPPQIAPSPPSFTPFPTLDLGSMMRGEPQGQPSQQEQIASGQGPFKPFETLDLDTMMQRDITPAAAPSPVGGVSGAPAPAPAAAAPGDIEAYIRQAALRRNMDPEVAVRVARSEGGTSDPVRQSDYVNPRTGKREESYGPFQLYLGGGLGNKAQAQGIDPRNPGHWQAAIDFALDEAVTSGWGPWYGAARAGIGPRQGLENARTAGVSTPSSAPPAGAGAAAGALPSAGQTTSIDFDAIVNAWKGVPYVFGGSGGRGSTGVAATDCSGFVATVLGLPAHTDAAYRTLQQRGGVQVPLEQAQPGDPVFYMGRGTGGAITHHIGIYAGNGQVVDMSTSGDDGVRKRPIGHAGPYEIIRDPTDQRTPAAPADAPPPIEIKESGVAERSGGQEPSQRQIDWWTLKPMQITPSDPLLGQTAVQANEQLGQPGAQPTIKGLNPQTALERYGGQAFEDMSADIPQTPTTPARDDWRLGGGTPTTAPTDGYGSGAGLPGAPVGVGSDVGAGPQPQGPLDVATTGPAAAEPAATALGYSPSPRSRWGQVQQSPQQLPAASRGSWAAVGESIRDAILGGLPGTGETTEPQSFDQAVGAMPPVIREAGPPTGPPVRDQYASEPPRESIIQPRPTMLPGGGLITPAQAEQQAAAAPILAPPAETAARVIGEVFPTPQGNEIERVSRGEAVNPLAYSQELGWRIAGTLPPELQNMRTHIGPVELTGRDLAAALFDPANTILPAGPLDYAASHVLRGVGRGLRATGAAGRAVIEQLAQARPAIARALSEGYDAGGLEPGRMAYAGGGIVPEQTVFTGQPSELSPYHPSRGGLAVGEQFQPNSPEGIVANAMRQSAEQSPDGLAHLTPDQVQALPGMPVVDAPEPRQKIVNGVPQVTDAGKPVMTIDYRGTTPGADDLREAIDIGMPHSLWYNDFGRWAGSILGLSNLNEFRSLFGITSMQTPVKQNFIYTLMMMRLARDLDAAGQLGSLPAWIKAVRGSNYLADDGQQLNGVKMTNDQIKKVWQAYNEGTVNIGRAKTSSYGGNIGTATRNEYDPNTTQDVWMFRLLGWMDSYAPQQSDVSYRATHALFDHLARERGINPNQAQAAAWFAIKRLTESPQTRQLAKQWRAGEISLTDALRQAQARGIYDPTKMDADDVRSTLDKPGVQQWLKAAQDVINPNASGPGRAADMILTAPGQKRSYTIPKDPLTDEPLIDPTTGKQVREPILYGPRPITPEYAELGRQSALEGAPQISLRGVPEGDVPGLENVPHTIAPMGDQTLVYLPGGNLDTATYAASALGQHLGSDAVAIHVPTSSAMTRGGIVINAPESVQFTPDQLGSAVSSLRNAGLDVFVDPNRTQLSMIVPEGADDATLATIIAQARQAAVALGRTADDIVGYGADVHTIGAGDYARHLETLGGAYGATRSSGVPLRTSLGGAPPPGAAPELTPSPESAAGMGILPGGGVISRGTLQNAAVGAAGANLPEYDEQGNPIEISPEERLKRTALGAVGGAVAGRMMRPGAPPMVPQMTGTRALGATDRMRQSGSPELTKLADMMDTEPRTPPTGPQARSALERMRRRWSQRLTDSNTTMNDLQKDALATGQDLPMDQRISSLQRINPDSTADMQIQREIMGPLREAGLERRKYSEAIATVKQNVDQANSIQQRVTLKSLATRRPVAGLRGLQRAEEGLSRAQDRLDATLASERTPTGPAHTAYGRVLEQQAATVERLAERVEDIRAEAEAHRLAQAGTAVEKAQADVDKLAARADDPDAAFADRRLQTEALHRLEVAERNYDRVQESYASRALQRETQAAEASLERATRLREKIEGIQTADRERFIANADRQLQVAQDRVTRARDVLDQGIQARIAWAQGKGLLAGEERMFSGGLNRADSTKALQDIKDMLGPQEYQSAEQLQGQLSTFGRGTLDILTEGGLVKHDVRDELNQLYPNYSKTNIIKYAADDESPNRLPAGRAIGLQDNGLKRLTTEGTSAAKQSPWEAAVADRYDALRRVQRNDVTGKFIEESRKNPDLLEHVKEVISREQWQRQNKQLLPGQTLDPERLTPDQARIGWFEKGGPNHGTRHEYIVDDWAKPLLEGSSLGEMNAYQKFLQEWRSAVTDRSVSFTERNIPRDAWQYFNAMLVRQGGPSISNVGKVVQMMAKSYRDAFRGVREGTYHGDPGDYLEVGGGYARASGKGLEDERQRVDDIARTGGVQIKNPVDFYHWLTDPLSEVNKRLELAPRGAAYAQGKAMGQSDLEAMIGARDLMAYEVMGDWVRRANRNVPFLGARVAGAMSQFRLAKKHPKTYLPTVMATTVAPAVAIEMYNRMDEDRSRAYDDVPPYLKYSGQVIMMPWAGKDVYGQNLPNYIYLPTGAVSPYSILGHAVGAAIMGKGAAPADYAEMFDAITQSLSPVDTAAGGALSTALGPVTAPAVSLYTNRDIFRGSDIVTKQADVEASRLGKAVAGGINAAAQNIPVVGPNINVHPSQIDYIARSAGQPGQALTGLSDIGRERPGEAQNIQDIPVVGGLISPLVGNRTGGVYTQERDRIMANEAGRFIRQEIGYNWTPPPVNASIGQIPLTRTERGEVQRDTNQLFNQQVGSIRQLFPEWDQYPREAKEQILKSLYTSAGKQAEGQLLTRYPDRFGEAEIPRRIMIEQERKAG